MEQYHQSQAAMGGFSDAMQQDPSMSAFSLFGSTQYPESVAFWHDPSAPAMALPTSYPSEQPTILQHPPDQKKHKRTRSGCFTCRARRIKCDESRPVGGRSAGKARSARPPSRSHDSPGKVGHDEPSPLEPIIDEEEPNAIAAATLPSPASIGPGHFRPDLERRQSEPSPRSQHTKQPSDPGPFSLEQAGSSPSGESSQYESLSVRSTSISQTATDLLNAAQLPDDIRFFLNFHQEFLTHEHFFLRQPSTPFIQHHLIELALQYEPLLYALVGFSAYHHTLQAPDGKLYSFLKYYNKALALLRKSLGSGEDHCLATLCTVLVLTTFEEYIGDWVNLIDHHRAAHALMRELLTPESSNLIELHTNIFLWYARFDVVVGILAGTEAILRRDWYLAIEQYAADQAASYPDDPQTQFNLVASINRRFGLDLASLYAKLSQGLVPYEDFIVQNTQLGQTLEKAKDIMRRFNDSEYAVRSYPNKKPLTEDDIMDPYVPGAMFEGPLWDANLIWIDLLSTELMYKYQTMLAVRQPLLPELGKLALEQCQLMETIDRFPNKPNGACIGFKNAMGIACLFLPREPPYQKWAQGKLAMMERNGYIIPPKFREVLCEVWQSTEYMHWWLPNGEDYPDIVRQIREMTDERLKQPRDGLRSDVRDLKTLFWKLNVDESDNEQSPPHIRPK
ncbi:hypothetical protein N7468_005905 [Penicillium chermesinum]|uniref:C6 finger domain protein n=1 Tax=Penicillium chermesinum TaxID=63820 RepID=A0A9W9P064_9EURO|nr:uncharacterized protein N7468_005905 [Penicillium chermesinum]KAJ5232949.1 hypothetical protein N7468_005905 [Penicillium chermesinum]